MPPPAHRRGTKAMRRTGVTSTWTKQQRPRLQRSYPTYGVPPGSPRGRKATDVELKFHDIDWDESAADMSAGVISNTDSLIKIGQGITESIRIGRKAVLKSVGWRGKLQLVTANAISAPQVIRLLLVVDTQCNGSAPTVTGNDGLLETANYQSFNDLNNKDRFKVLSDKSYTLNAEAIAGNGTDNDSAPVDRTFSVFKSLDLPIEYSGTANPSVIAEIRTNNVFGIMIASTAVNSVTLDSKFRFRFTE